MAWNLRDDIKTTYEILPYDGYTVHEIDNVIVRRNNLPV